MQCRAVSYTKESSIIWLSTDSSYPASLLMVVVPDYSDNEYTLCMLKIECIYNHSLFGFGRNLFSLIISLISQINSFCLIDCYSHSREQERYQIPGRFLVHEALKVTHYSVKTVQILTT